MRAGVSQRPMAVSERQTAGVRAKTPGERVGRAPLPRRAIADDRRLGLLVAARHRGGRGVWIARRPIADQSHASANSSSAASTRPTASTASACARRRSATSSSAIRKRPDLDRPIRPDPDPHHVERQRRGLSRSSPAASACAAGWSRGKVSWGEVDKLLPPPSGKPFAAAQFRARHRRQQRSRWRRRSGRFGVALAGSGQPDRRVQGTHCGSQPAAGPWALPADDLSANRCASRSRRGVRMSTVRSRVDRFELSQEPARDGRAAVRHRQPLQRGVHHATTAAGGWRSARWPPATTVSPRSTAS